MFWGVWGGHAYQVLPDTIDTIFGGYIVKHILSRCVQLLRPVRLFVTES